MRTLRCLVIGVALACVLAFPALAHEPEGKAAAAAMAEMPLLDGYGSHSHSIQTSSPEAQAYFDQGVRLLFNFNHADAIRSFEAAIERDPSCAICYWGIAFAYGPNINVPMMPEAVAPAWDAVQKAQALADKASEAEQAYIAVIAKRYAATAPADRSPLDQAFADEMRTVAAAYPDDPDAQVFFAEALMDLQPWDYWESDGKTPKGNAAEIIKTLESVIARWPDHPGALHLYIHAVEASSLPERAELAADRLLRLMPAAGHIVHMPSHIYYRVGRYTDSRVSNQAAVKSDEAHFAKAASVGVYPLMYYHHNIHFIWSSATMEGRSAEAIAAAKRLVADMTPKLVDQLPLIELFVPVHIEALTQFGRWNEVLDMPWPPKRQRFAHAMWHYARGLAQLATGDMRRAGQNLKAMYWARGDKAYQSLERFGIPATQIVDIAYELLAGEYARHRGKLDHAIEHFQAAVALQDALPYTEPPYWYYPARHTLGAALLEAKRYAEAEAVYQHSLGTYPNDGWALIGLAQALDAQGKTSEAAVARAQFDQAWAGADVTLTASRF
jgi:tetratricopeptide (TPR) repeat protein